MNDYDLEYTGIFTESSEDIGLLYSDYKDMKDDVTKLLEKIEEKIKFFLKDPKNYVINLKDDIDQFKKSTGRKLSPKEIDIRGVKSQKKEIKDFKNDLDKILKRYSSIKDKIAFGGNYFRAILKRPKVYSKEIDYDAYEAINRNIRNIDRAMDWIEKVLMDLYNMADHDLNVLTLVGEVYARRRIYESFDPSHIDKISTDDAYDIITATSRCSPEEIKIKTIINAMEKYRMESGDNMYEYDDDLDWITAHLMKDVEPAGKMTNEVANTTSSNKKYTMDNLPNILYFSSPVKVNELKGKVFLTPHIGISSIFIVDRFNILRNYASKILAVKQLSINANIEYDEWRYPNHKLMKPLSLIHMTHNIKDLPGIATGTSSGYIYTVDISNISKTQLSMFVTMDPDREIIYNGDVPLKIINVQEHTANWELRFDPGNAASHGVGTVKVMESYNSIDKLRSQYCAEGYEFFTETEEPPSMPDDDPAPTEEPKEEPEKESMPKKTDRAESSKNGVRRKKLYIAFIEWCKEYNNKNTFGSIFDKDAFKISYPFVPDEMRYFYRIANPMLCVLGGDLTFFPASELRKLNSKNSHLNEMMIFAATPNDTRVFNVKDKKVYRGTEENGMIKLNEVLGETFDGYIQKMINKGDILNGPIEEATDIIEYYDEEYY